MVRSVPVTAELQGLATIGGKTGELKMTIDYTSFVEVCSPLPGFLRWRWCFYWFIMRSVWKDSVQSGNFWDTKYLFKIVLVVWYIIYEEHQKCAKCWWTFLRVTIIVICGRCPCQRRPLILPQTSGTLSPWWKNIFSKSHFLWSLF